MERRVNRRGHEEHYVKGHHLKLDGLKQEAAGFGLKNQYLFKENVPESPQPEFMVSNLKHDTNQAGLRGIREVGGFRNLYEDSFIWWSLAVGPQEIQSAETRLLEETFPDRTEEQVSKQQRFLGKFTTSPAFSHKSRLGPYRFTFPVEDVLMAYREQFCGGEPPVMRIYETVLYKQEVMHVVLVHSPANQKDFSEYPLLPTDDLDAVCVFRDGGFIWRPEAMCETHRYKLIKKDDEERMEAQEDTRRLYYVWHHLSIAFHVSTEEVLRFDVDKLRRNLKFCRKDEVSVNKNEWETFEEAKGVVRSLWPDSEELVEMEEPDETPPEDDLCLKESSSK